jgi:hypothetical protein
MRKGGYTILAPQNLFSQVMKGGKNLAPPFLKVEKVEKIWLHLFSQVMKGGKN